MPWENGRVLVVAAGLLWAGAQAHAQAPHAPGAYPPGAARVGVPDEPLMPAGAKADPPKELPTIPAAPIKTLPAAPLVPPPAPPAHAEPNLSGVKDLTPPGFEHHEPAHGATGHGGHDGHHETPGNLLPSYPEEGGWYASADFLLLRPRRGAFDFAIPSTAGGLVTNGPVQSLNYELRTGVRAELGYRLGHSHWEVLAGYTYFRSSAFDAVTAGPGQALLPTLTRPGLTDTVSFAAADANLVYNVYDALVARRFVVGEHVALRMLGGMRFANIQQSFNAYYDGIDARQAQVRAESQFQGFGPVVGGEAVWAGWNGLHLYGRANGGLLTGNSENPLLEANGNGGAVFANTRYDIQKVVPFASVGVGGGWQYRTFTFRAGYEITHWFGLIDQPRFSDDVGRGRFVPTPANLSLEGLFVQMAVQF
ncbi:Lpg1974 family pore-forming outer membrane protein [Urbifossiella limnaea]|nr:Lpg1974 family pore-forming outer membrane protein [Urbifossiella limnaea]